MRFLGSCKDLCGFCCYCCCSKYPQILNLRTLFAGRCSVIDYNGSLLCDIYAIPEDEITDYRTPWSGIRKRDMVHAVPFDTARNTVKRILQVCVIFFVETYCCEDSYFESPMLLYKRKDLV